MQKIPAQVKADIRKAGLCKPLPAVLGNGILSSQVISDPNQIYRKTSCACGGTCPRCQTKANLAISQPNDPAEREADAMADAVMRMPERDFSPGKAARVSSGADLQRKSNKCEEAGELYRTKDSGSDSLFDTSSVGATVVSGGQLLSAETRAYFEPRFGQDFSNVRIHNGPQADRAALSVEARAFTLGRDVVFAAGEFDPGSDSGKRLLAHELTHVVQQSASDQIPVREEHGPRSFAVQKAGPVSRYGSSQACIQRTPSYIVAATFLGNNVGGGVNPVMRDRLQDAEAAIEAAFNALPAAQQVDFSTGQPTTSYIDWAGITSVGGWRSSTTSRHGSGSAVDLNYNTNPYIATGTVTSPGGEEGPGAVAGIDDARSRAIEVYQRAFNFMVNDGFGDLPNMPQSDVRARQPGESTGTMHDRFRQTSDALRDYLQFGFMAGSPVGGNRVNRAPIPNVETVTEAVLLAQIPLTERRDQASAVAELDRFMNGPRDSGIIEFDPWWPLTPAEQYIRILRDYELVRVPMEFGAVSTSPGSTRNPANGFLDIRREVAIALTDQGLAWLAGDIGLHSGDIMHFDIRNHAGYTPGA